MQPSLVRSKGVQGRAGPGQGQLQGLVLVRGNGDMGGVVGALVVARERQTNNTTHLRVHPTLGHMQAVVRTTY